MSKVTPHLISSEQSIREALGRINVLPGGKMTLIVVNEDGTFLGTLTDGDIRRALLAGVVIDEHCSAAAHIPAKAINQGEVNVEMIKSLRTAGLNIIPIIDANGRPVDLIDFTAQTNILPLRALLMAGGKGERLRPLTLTRPKPLVEIEGRAIIDYNIEALAKFGISSVTVATGYMSEMLEEYFAIPRHGIKVECVKETFPMGTIGAATLLELDDKGETLVMNSDLLTTASFEEMYLHHRRTNADITVAAIPYQVSIPFAILDTDGPYITGLEEKPVNSYYANAGIYIFSNKLLNILPHDKRTDATDLIEQAISLGKKVSYWPLSGTWIDVGTPSDFAHASELIKHHRTMSR